MLLTFYKYQGTGNDFIMIDNRNDGFPKNNTKWISLLCDRRHGIGADGLILLENDNSADFKMHYYNSDGKQGSMCGNGGRCIVAFAYYLGLIDTETSFMAVDGLHYATREKDKISLYMQDVMEIKERSEAVFLDTGSPHHVQLVENLNAYNVQKEGERLRYGIYGKSGSNINFVEQIDENVFSVRTYERGVENETLSCGTGVTAVALAMHYIGRVTNQQINIKTKGGELSVTFEKSHEGYKSICLMGPAKQVFKGELECCD